MTITENINKESIIDIFSKLLIGLSITKISNDSNPTSINIINKASIGDADSSDENYTGPLTIHLSNGHKLLVWSSEWGGLAYFEKQK